MSSNVLWDYFHKGEKQNKSHYTTFCIACVKHFQVATAEEYEEKLSVVDEALRLTIRKEWYDGGQSIHIKN